MTKATGTTKGLLNVIERAGNRLPDPVVIFVWLIAFLIVLSAAASWMGLSVQHPTQKDEAGASVDVKAVSLVESEQIRRLWVDMPETFTHFHPLGYVPVVMLGAGVAERSGLLPAAMLPYSFSMLLVGLAQTFFWVYLDLPLGPGAGVHYTLPSGTP